MTAARGGWTEKPCASLAFPTSPPAPASVSRHAKLGGSSPDGRTIGLTTYYVELDGRPAIPVMGEFHYSRYPRRYWDDALRAIKAGGVDILSTYVFWNHHEEQEGVFDWSGDLDLRSLLQSCARHGLLAVVRIGPFAHGECRNGGLPDWLYGRPFAVRSTDERFLAYVRRLYAAIAAQLAGVLFKDGGPVIGVQLDNEYMHCGAPWEVTYRPGSEWVPAGEDGVAYMRALKDLARAAGLDVPLYTCTAWVGSPVLEDEMLPLQGGYAFTPWVSDPEYRQPPTHQFLFRDRHRDPVTGGVPTYDATRYPYACCELGGGIQITYQHRPVVPAACVEAMAVVALGSGANLLGYYMYHGGSQRVGLRGYTNEHTVPRISYDFQAPIREFGQINESYRSLRLLHHFLHDYGARLAPMGVVPPDALPVGPEDTATLRIAARATGAAGFLFLTNYQDHVEMRDHEDVTVRVDTGDEVIVLPHERGLTLPSGASAILPINLMLGSQRLVYATAQPLTRLDARSGGEYVFFAPPGMPAEYAFASDGLRDIRVARGSVVVDGDRVYVDSQPGTGATIDLTAQDGTTVRVLTLTREQALQCRRVQLDGRERLVLSEATVLEDHGRLRLASLGLERFEVAVYPPLAAGLETIGGGAGESEDGIFMRYTVSVPAADVDVRLTPLTGARYLLDVRGGIPSEAADVLLRIRYVGDIGEAYLGGALISDNFCNGTPWEIGLKRFADRLATADFVLHIVPRRGTIGQVSTGMAARLEPAQDDVAAIESVEAIPEYRTVAWPAGARYRDGPV